MPDQEELQTRLKLWRVPGLGALTLHRLIHAFGHARHAVDASDALLSQSGFTSQHMERIRQAKNQDISQDLLWLENSYNHHILCPEDPHYPQILQTIRTRPPLLFVTGNPVLLNDPGIALVGTRNPTSGGLENARAFSRHLSGNGLNIISGLALGIDAASHQGALDEDGHTIAVVATGLDIVYPARHRQLAGHIAEQGALVSELPIGVKPQARNFPRRNRLISGLSIGTLVVEAALKSGSLVTAKHAMEQGREVFAIPGSIHNPLARGCHQLIRQGAKLVETAQDVLEEISPQLHPYLTSRTPASSSLEKASSQRAQSEHTPTCKNPVSHLPLGDDEALILKSLGHDPVAIDQIVLETNLTTEAVSSMLLMLELQGYIAACGGGRYMRLGSRNDN